MLLSWINSFQLLLAVLSGLLGYYMYNTRRCQALVVFLLGLSVHNLLRLAGENLEEPQLVALGNCMRFLYAPLVYFATRELLYKDFRYHKQHLIHLAPFAIALAFTAFVPGTAGGLGGLVGILVIAYLVASYRLVWQFRKIIAQTRSTGLPEGLIWLQRILHVYAALIVFEMARFTLGLMISDQLNGLAHMSFLIIVCALLCYLVMQGMHRPGLLPAAEAGERALTQPQPSSRARTPDQALAERLASYMEAQKPYLNPQLTVSDLAEALDASGRSLSEFINEVHGCNFSDFINKARVDEARALIADAGHANSALLDIGLAAGFNSKTSFNVMFKRHVGSTPSVYRKARQAN